MWLIFKKLQQKINPTVPLSQGHNENNQTINDKPVLGSVLATATTASLKDGQYICKGINGSLNAILTVDGLDSYGSDGISYNFLSAIAKYLSAVIERSANINNLNFKQIFDNIRNGFVKFIKSKREDEHLYGASVIILVETEKKIKIAYIGNGAIWHIRRKFNEFPAGYLFPWNAVNLLNPHIIQKEDKKKELYKYISDKKDIGYTPAIIEIDKDTTQGDIFMICTGRIYSEEQHRTVRDPEGRRYLRYENSMFVFFKELKSFFSEQQSYTNDKLEEMLKKYLETIKPDGDASLGVLITKPAIDYHSRNTEMEKK